MKLWNAANAVEMLRRAADNLEAHPQLLEKADDELLQDQVDKRHDALRRMYNAFVRK